MDEKRRYKRYTVEEMDVQCKMLFATVVKLLDMSVNGASVLSNKPLGVEKNYSLKIHGESGAFTLNGVVVWEHTLGSGTSGLSEDVPVYKAGLRFADVLTDTGNGLAEFLQDTSVSESTPNRVGGLRVKIDDETAVLGYQELYHAKRISIGGALIETGQALEPEHRYSMEMLIPGLSEPVMFLGRIVHCNGIRGKSPERYDVGIEFIDLDEGDRAKLKAFIDSIAEPYTNPPS